MPHIQIDINRTLTDTEKRTLAAETKSLFGRIMATGSDHIAISIREHGTYNLDLGRVRDHALGVALVNIDLRLGRSLQLRRDLATGLITLLQRLQAIPPEQIYVTFTEHKGEDFHLSDRYLADWQSGER